MKQKYTAVIVDDELLAVSLLKRTINVLSDKIDIVNTFTNWSEALNDLRKNNYDILFLDISIQGRNGIELARMIPANESELVFITAYSEYAIDAFRTDAVGYILKPIDEVELSHVLDKIIFRLSNKQIAQGISEKQTKINRKIAIPNGNIINYVATTDIVFLEGVQSYTKIILNSGEMLCSYSIGRFKHILPEHIFYQSHRSFIINLDHVKSYESSGIILMNNNSQIPLSKHNREEFLNLFAKVHK